MDKFIFGKYKDKSIDEVADEYPNYIIWAYGNIKNPKHGGVTKDLYEACMMDENENTEFGEDYCYSVDGWGIKCYQ